MSRLRAFGWFWWDFIVGDDWRIAAAVLVATAGTWALVQADVNAWWLLPLTAAAVLVVSVGRAARGG